VTLFVILILFLISSLYTIHEEKSEKWLIDSQTKTENPLNKLVIFENGLEDNCGKRAYSDQTISELSKAIQLNWKSLGASVPWWSVFAGEPKTIDINDQRKTTFYNSGQEEVNFIIDWSNKFNLKFIDDQLSIIDFGCGLARISWNLANYFKIVYCVDQSKTHLDIAKEETKTKKNINYIEAKIDDLTKIPNFDRMYSVISLQHSVPIIQYLTLKALFNKLNKDGQMIFQLASHLPGYKYRNDCDDKIIMSELSNMREGEFHVHPLSLNTIIKLAYEEGLMVVDVKDWDRVGGGASKVLYLMK